MLGTFLYSLSVSIFLIVFNALTSFKNVKLSIFIWLFFSAVINMVILYFFPLPLRWTFFWILLGFSMLSLAGYVAIDFILYMMAARKRGVNTDEETTGQ
jgi:hypothetical protein